MAELDSGRYLPWKAHRLRGKLTLEEIAGETRISKRFLEAIESGAYHELPGGVFTTSYIRQYSAMIEYDSQEILRHEGSGREPAEPEVAVKAPGWRRGLLQSVMEKG